MTELCEVVLTAPDPGWLKDLSRKLIEQRLCASAHNFAPVRSIYERTEGRVSSHTRRDRVAELHLTWDAAPLRGLRSSSGGPGRARRGPQ